jgi:ferric-dicitrate binding protein FerR (iron transport regulator)
MTREPRLDQLGRATQPAPGALERLEQRVNGSLGGASIPQWLALLPDAPAGATVRLQRRLEQGQGRRHRVAGLRPVLAGGGLLATCGLVLMLWQPWQPTVLDRALVAEQSLHESLTPAVALDYQGRGWVSGVETAPTIRWEQGQLAVEVEQDAGVDLHIRTREAWLWVVGTEFSVDRDLLGTHVQVTRGVVELRCEGGSADPVQLGAGQQHSCAPTSATGLLGRARVLLEGGDAAAALATCERALERATDGSPEQGELLVLQVELLLELGRIAAAREAARRYLELGHTARAEVLRPLVDSVPTPVQP